MQFVFPYFVTGRFATYNLTKYAVFILGHIEKVAHLQLTSQTCQLGGEFTDPQAADYQTRR